MGLAYTSFAVEIIKIAADEGQQKRRGGLLRPFVAAAPFAAAKAIAEVPKGVVEQSVSHTVRYGNPGPAGPMFRLAGAKALKAGTGLATAPMFLSGVRDIKEGKKERGLAKVVGSSAAYSALGGMLEGVAQKGLSEEALRHAAGKAKVRTLLGIGASSLTAYGLAHEMKRSQKAKKPDSVARRFLLPAALGAGVDLVRGSGEEIGGKISTQGLKGFRQSLRIPAVRREILGSGAGRVAEGALGAVILSELLRRMTKPKEKKAEAKPEVGPMGPTSGELYDQVRSWGADRSNQEIKAQYEAILAQHLAGGTPTKRAVAAALHDALQAKGEKPQPLPDMQGVTGRVRASTGLVDTATLAAAITTPLLVWNAVEAIPPNAKDAVLNDALDRLVAQKGIQRLYEGLPFWSPFGVTKAPAARIDPTGPVIGVPLGSTPGILAHEYGHASAGQARQVLHSGLVQSGFAAARVAAVVVPFLAVEGARDSSFTTAEDLKNRARFLKRFGALAALVASPALLEEALASGKGLSTMALKGATTQQLRRGALTMGAGFATHAAPLAVPFLAAGLLNRRARQAERKAEQTASRNA